VIITDRRIFKTPKQKETVMPKKAEPRKESHASVFSTLPTLLPVMEIEGTSLKDAKKNMKAEEKRKDKLDKISRRLKALKEERKTNDKDKAHYGKKLNKCIERSAKLEAEVAELLAKEQALQTVQY
jgi:hypothetical protein